MIDIDINVAFHLRLKRYLLTITMFAIGGEMGGMDGGRKEGREGGREG